MDSAINNTIASGGGVVTFDCDDVVIEFAAEEQIVINGAETVTIDGSNGDKPEIILQGGGEAYRTSFFRVESGGTLNLNHLTMTAGTAQNHDGIGHVGGAIYNNGGNLNLTASTITAGEALYGGAIYNTIGSGTVTVTTSTITGNHASYGGAIYNQSGTTVVEESRFEANASSNIGGAIVAFSGTTKIWRSTFIDNRSFFGGAIFNRLSNVTIDASTFAGNVGLIFGSAIYISPNAGTTSVSWSTIIQPEATHAALYLEASIFLTGVILGGSGAHCQFMGSATTLDSYTLSNDVSCDLDTLDNSLQGLDYLGLGQYSSVSINGVVQDYYPLHSNSLAFNAGPRDCPTPDPTTPNTDQLGTERPVLSYCDIGAIEFISNPPQFTTSTTPPPLEGEAVTVSATATNFESGATLHYSIDCGEDTDGDWEMEHQTSPSTVCTYPDNGSYTAAFEVSDGTVTVYDSSTINVANVAPAISPLALDSPQVDVGQPVTIYLTATDVPADSVTFSVACGNGTTVPAGPISSTSGVFVTSAQCSYSEPDEYTISATAKDEDGGESSAVTTKVRVVLPPPTIQPITPMTSNEDDSVTITVEASGGGSLTYAIDCDTSDADVPTSGPSNSAICSYGDNGVFAGRVDVFNGFATNSATFSVTVNNVAPVVTSVVPSASLIVINDTVEIDLTATDVPADSLTFNVDCDNSTSTTSPVITSGTGVFTTSASCSYTQAGSYAISVTATDDDSGESLPKVASLEVQVVLPAYLCANQWDGQLHMVDDIDDCGRNETRTQLPMDGPLDLCVNTWNDATRASDDCGRSEYAVLAYGDDSIAICVNSWNGVMRVSDRCSRSEYEDWL